MGVEIQRIRQAKGTVSDHWLSRSSCWFRCPDRGTSLHHVVEEVCLSWQPLTISFPLKRVTSRTRSCKITFDDNVVNGELAAEPSP